MKKTPLLNTKLVQHMDVPMIPNVLMLDAGENLDDKLFVRGDLLDALSVDIYFKDVKSKLLNVFDVVTTKLRNHISDTYCHTNPTEKRYWNNKLDKAEWDVAMATIQQRITELENTSGSTGEPVDLSGFITREQLSTALANIDWTQVSPNLSGYVKNGSLLGTINGVAFNQGSSITISGTGSGSTSYKVTGLSYNNGLLTLTQDNNSSISVNIPTGSTVDLSNYVTKSGLKTINGNSLIGSGNIQVGEGGSSFTLEPATATTLGGIKIGYAQSGRNYPVQLDANNNAYVNVPWYPGEAGESSYDDSEVRGLISQLESDLNQLSGDIDSTISTTVADRLADANWLRSNFPWGEVFHYDGWSSDMQAYLKTVGLIDTNGNVGWSELSQTVSSIEGRVINLEKNPGGGSTMTGTEIIQAIDTTNTPYTNMYSFYTNLDDDGNILKELVAGFKTQASSTGVQASQYAKAIGENSEGIAGVITKVDTIQDEVSSVRTEVGTKWSTTDGQNYVSGLVASATSDSAIASIIAKADSDTYAAIHTKVENDQTLIGLIASRVDVTTSSFTIGDDDGGYVHIYKASTLYGTIDITAGDADDYTNITTRIGGDPQDTVEATNYIASNGSGYFAGGNFSWDTSGNVTVKGTVHANAMYTTPKIIEGSSYTIDMKTDPHCLYILEGAEGKENYITLPHPGDYKGLELQFFLPIFTRGTADGFLLSTAETNGYFTPLYGLEGMYYEQYTTPTQSSWRIPMNKFVTVKSLPIGHNVGKSDEWLWVVISGYDEQS